MKRKTALVTGGSSGLGKRIVLELAKEKYDIAFTYHQRKKEADSLVRQLEEECGIEADCFPYDAAEIKEAELLAQQVLDRFGGIDIFVHCVGPYIRERITMSEYTAKDWHYIMNGNLNSFFHIVRILLPYMQQRKWGRLITFGYERSETAPAWIYRSAYAAAKSGLTSLTKTLAKEEAANGITVNMISPGDITREWKEKEIKDSSGTTDRHTPVGRPGTGEDVARVVSFLCKEESDFITGSVIPVTGGKDVLGKRQITLQDGHIQNM